jgi:hypothetical protein
MFAMHRGVFVVILAILAGCGHTIGQRDSIGNPRLERLSAAAAERIQPSTRAKLLADLVRLSREGLSPDQIIERYPQTGSRLKLNSAQLADLHQRRVDKRVLDRVVQHEREAEKVDALTLEADWDAAAHDRVERARRHYYHHRDPWFDPNPCRSPRVYPYAGYGWRHWDGGWHGGVTIGF